MKDMQISEHEPDDLDQNCDKVFEAIRHIKNVDEQIDVIEQVLDYLRIEKSHIEDNFIHKPT